MVRGVELVDLVVTAYIPITLVIASRKASSFDVFFRLQEVWAASNAEL